MRIEGRVPGRRRAAHNDAQRPQRPRALLQRQRVALGPLVLGGVAFEDHTGDAALLEGQRRGAAGEAASNHSDLGWSCRAAVTGYDAAAGAGRARLPARRPTRVGEALPLSRAEFRRRDVALAVAGAADGVGVFSHLCMRSCSQCAEPLAMDATRVKHFGVVLECIELPRWPCNGGSVIYAGVQGSIAQPNELDHRSSSYDRPKL